MKSIDAYKQVERIAAYDEDMLIMHPNREKMIDIALEVFQGEPKLALELGAGTGFLTDKFVKMWPDAKIVAVDSSKDMLDLAKTRLGERALNVEFIEEDFRTLDFPENSLDAVFSTFALHHLDPEEKLNLLTKVHSFLKPGGWFLNGDLVVNADSAVEERIQALRVDGVIRRNGGEKEQFSTPEATRAFLDELETSSGDQPVTLQEDLEILRKAGFEGVTSFWQEYREVVTGGMKKV